MVRISWKKNLDSVRLDFRVNVNPEGMYTYIISLLCTKTINLTNIKMFVFSSGLWHRVVF
jgi:hypothetical protein